MGLWRRLARARLAGRVVRRLRRAGLTEVRYDARAFQVRFTHPGETVPTILELTPLLEARSRKETDAYVAGLLLPDGLPNAWAEARPLLRPVLRGSTPGAPLRRPVMPFLYEFMVVDQPDSMTYVVAEQLAAWGVRADEAFAAARANLSGATLQGTAAEPVVVRFVDDGDAYWTSHLLLEHWLGRLAGQVGGTPVAFAPERGTLLVTADGSAHLRGLFAQAEEIYARSARPITPMAYASDENGCTVPYAAPPGHPLHRAVERAERVLAVQEYTHQAAQLPAEHAAADLLLVGSDEEGWRTRAVWARDEPVLLPAADEVQIDGRCHPWSEVAPRLSRAPGLEPARWSAHGWSQTIRGLA